MGGVLSKSDIGRGLHDEVTLKVVELDGGEVMEVAEFVPVWTKWNAFARRSFGIRGSLGLSRKSEAGGQLTTEEVDGILAGWPRVSAARTRACCCSHWVSGFPGSSCDLTHGAVLWTGQMEDGAWLFEMWEEKEGREIEDVCPEYESTTKRVNTLDSLESDREVTFTSFVRKSYALTDLCDVVFLGNQSIAEKSRLS
jgi:hypothetical protein